MQDTEVLDRIRQELEADRSETRKITASSVRGWMTSKDPDVLGATYGFLHSAHVGRVNPALSFDEVFDFLLRYYEWCIRTDPHSSAWANSRYSAGWDLVGWFFGLWDEPRDMRYFDRIKSRLAELYRGGDADLKKSIEHAVIEHLFERKEVRRFFADWQNDPELKPAYDEGMLWVTHGGSSPLSERQEKVH